MSQYPFANQTIVVTGGAGGLGAAIVRAFVAAGGHVVIADLNLAGATALAGLLGSAATPALLDVCDESSWTALLDRVAAEHGHLDVLVNNAGVFQPNIAFEDMPLDIWRKHFAVNADGVFLGCKHAIRRMKSRGAGAIVNMGSGMSLRPQASSSAYCGSKAAVLMTTMTAAAAAAAYGVRVNAVLPGAVPTPMLMSNVLPGQSDSQFLAQMASFSALQKLATPDDIARAVLFLADAANSAITGIYVAVDGGNFVR